MSGLPIWRLLFLVAISLKAGPLSAQVLPDPLRPLLNPEPYREEPGDNAETKLLKERVRHAQAVTEYNMARYIVGSDSGLFLQKSLLRLRESQIEFHTGPRDKVAVLTHHLALAKELERMVKNRANAGMVGNDALPTAGHYRATIELRLLQAKKTLAKEKP